MNERFVAVSMVTWSRIHGETTCTGAYSSAVVLNDLH